MLRLQLLVDDLAILEVDNPSSAVRYFALVRHHHDGDAVFPVEPRKDAYDVRSAENKKTDL